MQQAKAVWRREAGQFLALRERHRRDLIATYMWRAAFMAAFGRAALLSVRQQPRALPQAARFTTRPRLWYTKAPRCLRGAG
jgi:hypothetical protein